jgi:hypothetical protein
MESLIEKVKKENPDLETRELFNDTVKELLNSTGKMLVFLDGEVISIASKSPSSPNGDPRKTFPLEEYLKVLGDKNLEKEDRRVQFVGPLTRQMVAIMKEKKNTETPK